MMRLNARWLAWSMAAAVACGGDDGPTDPDGTDGTLTATIQGGSNFSATVVVAAFVGNDLVITATQAVGGSNTRSITLNVNDVTTENVYSLTLAGNSGSYVELTNSVAQSWLCAISQGTGEVSFTEVSSTRLIGSFTFTAPANTISGATGTKVISGSFNVVPSNPE